MPFITVADLASYLRNPAVASDTDAQFYVDLANGTVEDVIGTLATVPTRVKSITLEIAARAWRNPNGYSSETIDDYTYRRDADTRQAGVYLTDAERAELVGYSGKTVRRVGTIPLTNPLDVA